MILMISYYNFFIFYFFIFYFARKYRIFHNNNHVIALALAVYAATQFRGGIEVEEVWKW